MVVYRYKKEKNPRGSFIPGVGLRDLDEDAFKALPDHLKRSVADSPFYERVEPETEPDQGDQDGDAAAAEAKEPKQENAAGKVSGRAKKK